MKIVEIIESETNTKHVVFRVEPPMTKEVFDAFQSFLKNTHYPSRSLEDGKLKVSYDPQLSKESIKQFNEVLGRAVAQVAASQEKAKQERQEFLKVLAGNLGLEVK